MFAIKCSASCYCVDTLIAWVGAVRVWLMSCIISILGAEALAYDNQLSVYATAAPARFLETGLGLTFATTVANRTVLGLGVLWPELPVPEDGGARISLDGRLLFSSDPDTHWYPQVGLLWQPYEPCEPAVQVWVGLGLQHHWNPELGFFAESLWQPSENQYRYHVGLRLWLDSFRSLDSRVQAADPIGVVYRGGRRPLGGADAPILKPVLASSAALETGPDSNSLQLDPIAAPVEGSIAPSEKGTAPILKPVLVSSAALQTRPDSNSVQLVPVAAPVETSIAPSGAGTAAILKPVLVTSAALQTRADSNSLQLDPVAAPVEASIAPSVKGKAPILKPVLASDEWYLQLGLFRQRASLQPLLDDPRLEPYQSLLISWYDSSAPGIRLLLGPFSRSEASSLEAILQVQELDSFMYQQPD